MKISKSQHNQTSGTHSNGSFFGKNEERSVFSNSPTSEKPFFAPRSSSSPSIQRKFAGTDGKDVSMLEKAGKIVISSKNAPADLTELVRLVNESGSKTAVLQIMKANNNMSKIHVKIEEKEVNNGLYGLHQAHDSKGNPLKWDNTKGDFDGTPAYVEGKDGTDVYKEATITIFKGNLKKGGGNSSSHDSAGVKLTLEQLIAGTFSHETGHNTDKEFIGDLRNKREGKTNKGIGAHKNIDPLDDQVYKEIGEYTRANNTSGKDQKEVTK